VITPARLKFGGSADDERRDFAGLGGWSDESTILRFRHLLERHKLAEQILVTVNDLLQAKGLLLKAGTVVDATLIAAPSSTKNASGERDPEMHQTKKGNQWHFGMKAHIGVDADSGLVHTVRGTAANVNDVVEGNSLLHGDETVVFADAGYQGADKRPNAQADTNWQVAMKPGKRRALDKNTPLGEVIDQIEKLKASVRAKVEHPFRVIKRQGPRVTGNGPKLPRRTSKTTRRCVPASAVLCRPSLALAPSRPGACTDITYPDAAKKSRSLC
jgi:IS5 family transposase